MKNYLSKKAFLVDVDNTLFDTEKIRPYLDKVTDQELIKFFKDCLFPNALETLKRLKKMGKVLIFSSYGLYKDYQLAKLKVTGIEELAGKGNILTFEDKHLYVKQTIEDLKKQGYTQIYLLDDRATILEEAHRVNPNVVGILMVHGKYKDTPITNPDAISFKANSLEEAFDFLSTWTCYLDGYQIRSGLTKKQKEQLVHYSHTDPQVQRFTSDPTRFKNQTSLNRWFSKVAAVYTLADAEDNLLGIIWFNSSPLPKANYLKKMSDKYKVTFAIRTYEKVRGKGLAQQFMEKTFADFKAHHIWLSTSDDNIPGKKLYQKFGFIQVSTPDKNNKIIMVWDN